MFPTRSSVLDRSYIYIYICGEAKERENIKSAEADRDIGETEGEMKPLFENSLQELGLRTLIISSNTFMESSR